jgi:hypothetical protein
MTVKTHPLPTLGIVAVAAAVLLLGLIAAAPASAAGAAEPWWHLSSGAQPSYLQTEPASLEVQDVTVSGSPGELFVLANLTPKEAKEVEEGKRSPETNQFVVLPAGAQAGTIETELEGIYGPGNVEVTGGPGAQIGLEPYVVTFKGALAYEPVGLINTELSALVGFAGSVTVTQAAAGRDSGEVVLSASNLGDANANEAGGHVTVTDRLPAGMNALAATGLTLSKGPPAPAGTCSLGSAHSVTCEFGEPVVPYDGVEVHIKVGVEKERQAGEAEANEASISGGGAPSTSTRRMLTFGGEPSFGVEDYELAAEAEGGTPDTQAGSHPFQLTTTLKLNQAATPLPAALVKDLNVQLPAGLIGNPTPFSQCTLGQFHSINISGEAETRCPSQSVVGVATVMVNRIIANEASKLYRVVVPVFNIEPAVGEPARFGFFVPEGDVPVLLDTSLRTGEDYGVTVSIEDISQAVAFLSSEVTFWGVPGSPSHDNSRGYACIRDPASPTCSSSEEPHPPPLLTLPSSCTGPLQTSVQADSWTQAGHFETFPGEPMPALDNCGRLPFSPQIALTPDGQAASTPTGLTVDVHVPQEESLNANGLSESDPKNITVVLPEGLQLNPAAADGLQACTEAQIGFKGENPQTGVDEFTPELPQPLQPGVNFCPDSSKIANFTVRTPLLANPLKGAVYLASPQNFRNAPPENPFKSLVALYLVAKDPVSGVLIKLPASVSLNEATGQITTTLENSPQAPFEDAEFEFFGGDRAPLATPALCRRPGEAGYKTLASMTSWSAEPGEPPSESSSEFNITSGPDASACPNPPGVQSPNTLPFTPSLTAGTTNVNAAAFSALTTTIAREDGQQNLQTVQLHMPAGLSGILAGVKLCPEAQANAGTCPAESRIGSTIVSVGLGGNPYSVTGGEVFLTEKYENAPFGLSIVNSAIAGPFNLGKVIVRAKIEINPHTTELTITTGTIPHILDGIPLQIKHVNVTIERPGFTFNPTNCSPMAITGNIGSVEGSTSAVSIPFAVTNCAALKFAPKFAVSTSGKTSKEYGASLTAKLSYPTAAPGTQANIARVKVDLPKQLPSRLTTLQKACTNAQFEANPANCPSASKIGHAKVTTPLLPVPLEGPAIFVSHGGEAFPSLTMVLQGYGVTVDLVGTTFISKGITSTTFKTVPDVPFSTFTLTLPQGKYSALAANGDLCTSKLAMPTEFLAQNGAVIRGLTTPISVTGCAKTKALTRAQKLSKALKTCDRKTKPKRARCMAKARKQYSVSTHAKGKKKHS